MTEQWFLDLDGVRSGPYHTPEVMSLIAEGEVLPHHRIATSLRDQNWETVLDWRLNQAKRSTQKPAVQSPQTPPQNYRTDEVSAVELQPQNAKAARSQNQNVQRAQQQPSSTSSQIVPQNSVPTEMIEIPLDDSPLRDFTEESTDHEKTNPGIRAQQTKTNTTIPAPSTATSVQSKATPPSAPPAPPPALSSNKKPPREATRLIEVPKREPKPEASAATTAAPLANNETQDDLMKELLATASGNSQTFDKEEKTKKIERPSAAEGEATLDRAAALAAVASAKEAREAASKARGFDDEKIEKTHTSIRIPAGSSTAAARAAATASSGKSAVVSHPGTSGAAKADATASAQASTQNSAQATASTGAPTNATPPKGDAMSEMFDMLQNTKHKRDAKQVQAASSTTSIEKDESILPIKSGGIGRTIAIGAGITLIGFALGQLFQQSSPSKTKDASTPHPPPISTPHQQATSVAPSHTDVVDRSTDKMTIRGMVEHKPTPHPVATPRPTMAHPAATPEVQQTEKELEELRNLKKELQELKALKNNDDRVEPDGLPPESDMQEPGGAMNDGSGSAPGLIPSNPGVPNNMPPGGSTYPMDPSQPQNGPR